MFPLEQMYLFTLSKKRNATNLTVVIFSVLLIGLRKLGDSLVRHVTDLFVVFIQAEQHLFNVLFLRLVLTMVGWL